MTLPRTDILLATHNGARFLREQIESILAQTYVGWQLLISDDASVDDTRAIAKFYARRDSRIVLVSDTNHGSPAANFLSLLKISDADVLLLCDQDDYWEADKVERLVAAFPNPSSRVPFLVGSDALVVDRDLRPIARSFLESARISTEDLGLGKILAQNPVLGCTTAFNRALRDRALHADLDSSQIIMHDWWLALVAAGFGTLTLVPNRLVRYRQQGNNHVGAFDYSLKSLVAASAAGRQKTMRIVRQAAHFRSCYEGQLPSSVARALDSFLDTFEAPPCLRPYRLAKGGHLKTGFVRLLGQMAFAIDYRESR